MQTKLERIEVEPILRCDYDLAIQHATAWQLRSHGIDHLGKVPIERLLIAALNQDLVSIAKHECPKAIPLGLEDPRVPRRQFADSLSEHRQDRRIHRKLHVSHAISAFTVSILSASSGRLSVRQRAMRGNLTATPDLWRDDF